MNALDTLTSLRPSDAEIDASWAPTDREARLEAVLATAEVGPGTLMPLAFRPRARRRRTLIGAGVVAAVLAIALPLSLPHGSPAAVSPAAAAELERLAAVAANAAIDRVGPGQFLYRATRTHQDGLIEADEGTERYIATRRTESWAAADGTTWQVSTLVRSSDRPAHELPITSVEKRAAGGEWLNFPNPSYLTRLPTSVDKLEAYLRSHVSGSTSTNEAIFVAVGDMVRNGFAAPGLRAAAIGVLQRTPGVDLGPATTDALGREIVEFTFTDNVARPGTVAALRFNSVTADLVEEVDFFEGTATYTSTVETTKVVDEVPRRVIRQAVG